MKVKHVLMIATVLLAMIVMPVAAEETEITYTNENYETYELSVPPTVVLTAAGQDVVVEVAKMPNYPMATVNVKVSAPNDEFKLTHKLSSAYTAGYDVKKGAVAVNSGAMILNALNNGDKVTLTLSLKNDEKDLFGGEYEGKLTFTATEVRPTVLEESETLSSVISGSNGPVVISLPSTDEGATYPLPSMTDKDVTIVGDESTVIDIKTNSKPALQGTDLTLVGVTVETANAMYTGIQHSGDVVYDGCKINGTMCLYGDSVIFKNCEFRLYNDYIWTYGAKEVLFEDCTFTTDGKAILVYKEQGEFSQTVTIKDCTFTATKTAQTGKGEDVAAVEIDSHLITGTYTLKFEGTNTIETGDDEFAGWYRVKEAGSGMTDQTNTNVDVFINGVEQPFTVGNNPVTPSP